MRLSRKSACLTRRALLDYFLEGAVPREQWKVGVEVEKLGRRRSDGRPLPYQDGEASVRRVLEFLIEERSGDPVYEAVNLIGIDAPWGAISLEPGGQVEWSSLPRPTLSALREDVEGHLRAMERVAAALGVRWLDVAVDPELPVHAMSWMPKARYKIMRSYLGKRGRLAHRMMTQTASIQCAFDYADPADWKRKFVAAALLAPVATALFANSSRADGADSGYRSYRQAIWRETDPDRCGLPAVVFDEGFGLEAWLDWILSVPTMFLHRARGLAPSSGAPFGRLLQRAGCQAVTQEDWETHVSTIFTEVRSYTYIEVRCADLLPDALCFAVPAFWTGILYDERALDEIPGLLAAFHDHEAWMAAMDVAARDGLDGVSGGIRLREAAQRALGLAAAGLSGGARWIGDRADSVGALEELAAKRELTPR